MIITEVLEIFRDKYDVKSVGWKRDEYRMIAEFQIAPGAYVSIAYYPMLKGGKKDADSGKI